MDVGNFMNVMTGILVLTGIGSVIIGIIKLIKAKKQQKGTGYKIKVILGTVFTVIITVLFVFAMDIMLGEIGEYPMANYPSSIENITYGQAFGIACEDVNWSGVNESASEDGNSYIQMDGKCMYGGEKHKIKVQFQYHFGTSIDSVDETTPFEISFVGLDNDIEVYKSDMEDIIYSMFKMYADKNNIPLDESVKDGILYTSGWLLDE